MKRKLIATLLALSLVMTLAPIATIFASADTSTENVVTVSNADDLLGFAQDLADGETFEGKTISITADIDLSGKTWPALAAANFSGVINGNGNTISGITATGSIFGNLQPVADFTVGVKNLIVVDSTVSGAATTGGLFSAILGDGNAAFEKLMLDIDVTATGKNAGTIAATSAATELFVKDVVAKGTVSSSDINVGGFFGHVVNTVTMTNCVFEGTVACSSNGDGYGNNATAGFIALAGGKILGTEAANVAANLTVTASAFYGKIEMTGSGASKVAGILGNTNGSDNSVVTIENVIVAGEVDITKIWGNSAILNGIGASTSTGTYNNVVGSMSGTIAGLGANWVAAHFADPATWPWAGKSGSALGFTLTNNIMATVDENTTSLVFTHTDETDPENPVTTTVDLSADFTISEVAGKPVPNGVVAFYAEEVSVGTADELVAVAQAIADGKTYAYTTINLTADIDLTGKTWPALAAANFSGMIDGNGNTISGITATGSIFGNLQPVAYFTTGVKNLTVEESTVTGAANTAGLFVEIKAGENVVFENLALDIDVTATGAKVATIAASSSATVAIKNVVVRGTISSTADNVAGFIATMTGTMTFDNCVFEGVVESAAYVQWGGTPAGGFIATAGKTGVAGIVTFTNCAYYGQVNMTTDTLPDGVAENMAYSYGVGKIAPFVAQTNGQDHSVLNFQNILVAGEINVARQLMYNYGALWGSLSSTGTANVDNVVVGLTGTIKAATTAAHTDINAWGLGNVSSNQGKLNQGNVVKATIDAETLTYSVTITDETDPENPVDITTTVDLSATFTYSEVAEKVVPNGVVALYVAEPVIPDEPVVPGPGDNTDDTTTTEPATTEPAPTTTTGPEKFSLSCKNVVSSAAGVLFAAIMAGAVCLGKRKED